MRFSRRRADEPEINVIPFIDVLLVVLIFLMLSTTFSRFTELQVTLPSADAEQLRDHPTEVIVMISNQGQYAVNSERLESGSVEALTQALQRAAQGRQNVMVIISADAAATHQSVINAMDAARRAGLVQLTFAAQTGG